MTPRRRKKIPVLLPGDKIPSIKGTLGPGVTRREDGKNVSVFVGQLLVQEKGKQRVIQVAPLKTAYIPVPGDIVVGKIIEVGVTSWSVDINSPYAAILPLSEVFSKPTEITRINLSKSLKVGDVIIAKVVAFDLTRDPVLTIKESKLGKVPRGTYLELTPLEAYVFYRRIGEEKFVETVKQKYGCELFVGKNFRIILIGESLEAERNAMHEIISTIRKYVKV